MRTFEERLADETSDWVREGLVSAEQAAAIRRRYDGGAGDERWSRLVQVLAIGGAIAVGLGVILFFAANWSEIPRFTRLALIVVAIVASYAAGDRLRPVHPHVGHALLLLGCILFGASLFLVGQMENVSTHDPLAFLLWALAATGGAVLFRSQPFAALAAVTGGACIVVELVDADAGSAALLAVGLYAVAVYAFGTRLGVGVLRALGAAGALAVLFPLTFGEVADEVASADVRTAAVVAGVALAALALATVGWLATDAQRPTARAEAAACGVLVLLFCTAPLLDLGPLLPNVVLLALAAGAIAAGYATGEPWLANIGLAVATVEILVRFFDYFARIMPRSVAFLVGGAIALTLAWALERNHRRIVGRAAR